MKKMNRLFALAMALCLAFAMMTVASASNEATSSGGSATSQVTLSSTADGSRTWGNAVGQSAHIASADNRVLPSPSPPFCLSQWVPTVR